MSEPLLNVRDLRVEYPGQVAVDGVSLHLDRGETLGLVGESGSGKSSIGHAIVGLVRPSAGEILVHGKDVTRIPVRRRHRVQIVFQDPYGSLNPSRTIGGTLAEPLRVVLRLSRREAAAMVADALESVGMPPDAAGRYPGAFSGGQRQRIAIARALVLAPELIVCDEPTSALDVSVQAQILNLLMDLQQRLGVAYLFISHDIDVVRHMAHRVAVLLKGRIVEQGSLDEPHHRYTRALLDAARQVIPVS
ncbi:ATP-binding cassette domain-containing protein [Actinocrispum sp. NPDC049592]|uniref:ATP-binding cassette domain-containing protein n=1 Tax=Actinocrispum sp. NPDC049592 TaxID=3154835 RepID=UPI00343D0119